MLNIRLKDLIRLFGALKMRYQNPSLFSFFFLSLFCPKEVSMSLWVIPATDSSIGSCSREKVYSRSERELDQGSNKLGK